MDLDISNTNPNIFFISHRKMSSYHGNHLHGFYEILYLFSGERSFFINDRTVKMKTGDLILIHPNVLHKATNDTTDDCKGILLYFYDSRLPLQESLSALFESDTIHLPLALNDRIIIEELFLKMRQESNHQQTDSNLLLQALAIQLLVYLNRYLQKNQPIPFEHPSPIHEKISEIALYINSHYDEKLSLELLAEHFYISPSYLSRIFKRVTNFTLVEYINNVRIKEAKRLLMETKLKVVEIAEATGFGSITHFGRVFKEITGNPPKYYRS